MMKNDAVLAMRDERCWVFGTMVMHIASLFAGSKNEVRWPE
jgi:hypothetical protein